MIKTIPLLKTCQICGLQKPLAAFLQLSDQQGTVYGNICSHCRKKQAESAEEIETTTSKTDNRIGHEQKVALDLEKREHSKQKRENYYKERDEAEEEQLSHLDKIDTHQKSEKKHRQEYIEKTKNPAAKISTGDRSIFGGVEQAAKEARTDFSVPVIDTAIPKIKHQSIIFKQFAAWLGPNAPITQAAQKLLRQNEKKPPPNNPKEFIEKNWVPPNKKPGK